MNIIDWIEENLDEGFGVGVSLALVLIVLPVICMIASK